MDPVRECRVEGAKNATNQLRVGLLFLLISDAFYVVDILELRENGIE